jgi:glutamine cyclotransferase
MTSALLLTLLVVGCDEVATPPVAPPLQSVLQATVIRKIPHDRDDSTQGLTVAPDGVLLESTGERGHSRLKRVDPETGRVLAHVELGKKFFGEGITVMGPDVHWLTWQEETGFVYDARTLVKKGSFRYPGPGWGLTTHHKQVVMSDGSALIKWRNPQTYKIERQQHVHEGQTRIDRINELEYVRGEIWACVLPRDHIVRIDPLTGRVRGWINASGLLTKSEAKGAGPLNGIAWDSYTDRLWVTGKKWPVIVEISVPKTS